MVKCCVPNCSNASYRKSPDITFHRFPKAERKRNLWVKNINRTNWQPNAASVICSKHFAPHLLCEKDVRTVLAPYAIPTLFEESNSSEDNKENVSAHLPGSTRKRNASGDSIIVDLQNKENVPAVLPESDRKRNLSGDSFLHAIPSTSQYIQPDSSSNTYCSKASTSSEKIKRGETSKIATLQNKIIANNRKIKALQERNRRMTKKVQQFADIIAELRKKLNQEQMSILTNIPVNNKDFMVRYLKKAQNLPTDKAFPPEIRSFALQLNFYSARAYNYVRNCFNTVLPHPGTLSRWYKKIHAQPGFTSESFDTLRSLSQNTEHKIFVNLVVDEMAIKKEQVWDRSHSKFRGQIDTGTEVSDDSLPLATQALVLMVTAINAFWKLPIAFFFIVSMTGEERANIIRMSIQMLYDIKIYVRGLTFDGAASNISMATLLGCQFNLNNLTPFFHFKDLKIFAFYDPSHMLKLIRNCFGDIKTIVDIEGNYIKFEYLIILEKLAEEKGLHLGVKIRKAHIYFQKQKMKVRLAAQLFSRSVADALIFCKDILHLEQFKECAATINFINLINDCFDILNSRTTLAPGKKKLFVQQT